MTIDAMCATVAGQLPILSKFGAKPVVQEDPASLYIQAIQYLWQSFSQEKAWTGALKKILLHLMLAKSFLAFQRLLFS